MKRKPPRNRHMVNVLCYDRYFNSCFINRRSRFNRSLRSFTNNKLVLLGWRCVDAWLIISLILVCDKKSFINMTQFFWLIQTQWICFKAPAELWDQLICWNCAMPMIAISFGVSNWQSALFTIPVRYHFCYLNNLLL